MDFPNERSALALARELNPRDCRLKVGKQLFTAAGPKLVEQLMKIGFDIFLDLKFHDIPNTVKEAVIAARSIGVWMLNVHASGGREMMEQAVVGALSAVKPPLVIGVTMLTSLKQRDLKDIGVSLTPEEWVLRLGAMAADAGLDGVVCSAQEVAALRRTLGEDFILVTPGIRPRGVAVDDQARVMTPYEAILAGSNYLVMGRPIIEAPDPRKALLEINQEVWRAEQDLTKLV